MVTLLSAMSARAYEIKATSPDTIYLNGPFPLPQSFTEGFDEGASKGWSLLHNNGQAVVTTQLITLIGTYNNHRFTVVNTGGGASTILPVASATGLDLGGDQVSGEGVEISAGWYQGTTGAPWTCGTSPAWKHCASVTVDNCEGAADMHVAVTGLEARRATFNNYVTLAAIGIEGTACDIQTITTGGTTTDTGVNATDGVGVTYCILLAANCAVTYTLDGVANTPVSYSIPDGLQLVPAIWFAHAAGLAGAVNVTSWSWVPQ